MSRRATEAYAKAGLKPAPLALASSESDGVLTFDLFDVIGRDMFGDGITASALTAGMSPSAKTVRVRINSPGGVASEGHAIRSILRSHAAEHGARIEVEIHGLAASAATVIAMAGDSIKIAADARFMIHEAHGLALGGADDFRRAAESVDSANDQLARVYVAATGKSDAEIRAMMKAETWMSAEEAVSDGFADEVMAIDAIEPEAFPTERVFAALEEFHAPADVLDRYRTRRGSLLVAAMADQPAKADDTMKRETLIALLSLDASANDEAIAAAIKDNAQAMVLLVETREELKAANDKVAEMASAKTVQDIEHRVSLACTTGHDGKGPRLTRTAADALSTKLVARAKKGGLALECALEDLTEIEGRSPVSGTGPTQVKEPAALDAPAENEIGLTAAEIAHCERTGHDPKEFAKAKVEAKAYAKARRNGTED